MSSLPSVAGTASLIADPAHAAGSRAVAPTRKGQPLPRSRSPAIKIELRPSIIVFGREPVRRDNAGATGDCARTARRLNLTDLMRALTGASIRVRTDVQREGAQWPTMNST